MMKRKDPKYAPPLLLREDGDGGVAWEKNRQRVL